MRFEAAAVSILIASAAATSAAAADDVASRVDLAGAVFRPLAPPPEPAADKAKGPVLYVEAFIPGRGLVRWAAPAAETGRLTPLAPPAQAAGPAGAGDVVHAAEVWAPTRLASGVGADFARPAEPQAVALGVARPGPARRGNLLGVKEGTALYGDAGRWFLFAAIRGQAIGYVVGAGPGTETGQWETDRGGFTGQGQAGLGYRKGPLQASLGYVYERVHFQGFGLGSRIDNRLGVTLDWRTGMPPTRKASQVDAATPGP